MSLRAPKDTAESLRLMLRRLEQTADPDQDPEARAELKRILMVRIANLEALEALKAEALKSAAKEPPRLPSIPTDPVPPPLPEGFPPPAVDNQAPVTLPPDTDRS